MNVEDIHNARQRNWLNRIKEQSKEFPKEFRNFADLCTSYLSSQELLFMSYYSYY